MIVEYYHIASQVLAAAPSEWISCLALNVTSGSLKPRWVFMENDLSGLRQLRAPLLYLSGWGATCDSVPCPRTLPHAVRRKGPLDVLFSLLNHLILIIQ